MRVGPVGVALPVAWSNGPDRQDRRKAELVGEEWETSTELADAIDREPLVGGGETLGCHGLPDRGRGPARNERPHGAGRQSIEPAQFVASMLGDGSLAEVAGDLALHGQPFHRDSLKPSTKESQT